MKMLASIPPDRIEANVKWLVLETDELESGGCFLFLLDKPEAPALFDEWYESVEQVLKAAELSWGVCSKDWVPI